MIRISNEEDREMLISYQSVELIQILQSGNMCHAKCSICLLCKKVQYFTPACYMYYLMLGISHEVTPLMFCFLKSDAQTYLPTHTFVRFVFNVVGGGRGGGGVMYFKQASKHGQTIRFHNVREAFNIYDGVGHQSQTNSHSKYEYQIHIL